MNSLATTLICTPMRLNKKFGWGDILHGGANLLLSTVAGPFTPLIKVKIKIFI